MPEPTTIQSPDVPSGRRIYFDQPPLGGCENCGAPVRTRKANGWVCWRCDRELAGRQRPR
jgi:ribosomal protein L37AE/L43A